MMQENKEMKACQKNLIQKFSYNQEQFVILKPRFNYNDFLNKVRTTLNEALLVPRDLLEETMRREKNEQK